MTKGSAEPEPEPGAVDIKRSGAGCGDFDMANEIHGGARQGGPGEKMKDGTPGSAVDIQEAAAVRVAFIAQRDGDDVRRKR